MLPMDYSKIKREPSAEAHGHDYPAGDLKFAEHRERAEGRAEGLLGMWTAGSPSQRLSPCPPGSGKRHGVCITGTMQDPGAVSRPPIPGGTTQLGSHGGAQRPCGAVDGQVERLVLLGRTWVGSCWYAPLVVNGLCCSALVDTGSSATVLRPDVVGTGVRILPTTVKLQTVTGERAPMLGETLLSLTVGRKSVRCSVWVADLEDCILGLDVLRALDCVIDTGRGMLSFPDGGVVRMLRRPPLPDHPAAHALSERAADFPPDLTSSPAAPEDTLTLTSSAHYAASCPPLLPEEPPDKGGRVSAVRRVWEENCDGLTAGEQGLLWQLLLDFKDCFSFSEDDMGRTDLIHHDIDTGEAQPVRMRPRRLPLARQAAAEKALREMQHAGLIEPSTMLAQVTPGGEKVVAYHSRAFNKAERRYCVTRRELLAVVCAIRHFKYYLGGLHFTVRTDHAALQWLMSFKEPEGQLARWIEELQAYDFEVVHRPGVQHRNADALSRRPCAQDGCHYCERKEAQEEDQLVPDVKCAVTGVEERPFCQRLVAVDATEWRHQQGEDADIKPVLGWIEEQKRPQWEEIAILSRATKGLWSMFDALRRHDGVLQRGWKEPATGEMSLPDQEAETIVDALVEGMFSRFGVPEVIHTDQGRNFESRVFAAMCEKLGSHKTRTTPLHPQSDGLVERFNRTLAEQLALVTAKHQRDWDSHVPLVLMAYRSAVQDSTSCSPALLMLAREIRTPAEMMMGRPPNADGDQPGPDYARKLQDRMESAHDFARRKLTSAGARQKRNYDVHSRGRHFDVGELVWVYNPQRKKGRCPKLSSDWVGPCKVLERLGEVVYRVQLPPRGRRVALHRDRLAPYRGTATALTQQGGPQTDLDSTPADAATTIVTAPTVSPVSPGPTATLDADPPPPPSGRLRPRRHHRPPGHLRDFIRPRGRGTLRGRGNVADWVTS
ncbi:unnamed protein product [Oreochromis niloticus]|nr:unnamed protein product [Mustela putorius furo]